MSAKRVVLVVGASSGIGAACAERLRKRGARVFTANRRFNVTTGDETLFMDVVSDSSVEAAVAALLARTSRLDAVVYCAGYALAGPVETTSLEEVRAQFETNLFGFWRVCRVVLPTMRRQQGGHIVAIGSLAGRVGLPFQAGYCASKFAMAGFVESLAAEVRHYGVRVTIVEPGNLRTPFTDTRRVAADAEGSGYRARFRRMLAQVEREERAGGRAEAVARVVERVLDDPFPRVREDAGPMLERLALLARHLLPRRLFERVLVRRYGGDSKGSEHSESPSGG